MMLTSQTKKIAAAVVVGVLVVGGIWWMSKKPKVEEEIKPEIILESSKMIESDVGLQMPMAEAEKQAIEETFVKEGAEMTVLKDVSGGQGVGTAWRHWDGSKFYHKAQADNLPALEKGFFYEGWLVGEAGFFSTGRMAVVSGKGSLYYTTGEDKTEFGGVVITLEAEDGDPKPDKHILEGNF